MSGLKYSIKIDKVEYLSDISDGRGSECLSFNNVQNPSPSIVSLKTLSDAVILTNKVNEEIHDSANEIKFIGNPYPTAIKTILYDHSDLIAYALNHDLGYSSDNNPDSIGDNITTIFSSRDSIPKLKFKKRLIAKGASV